MKTGSAAMQRLRLPSGIRFKVNLGILTILLLSSLMIAGFTSQIVSQALFREYRYRGVALALNLADRSEDPLLALDYLRMKTVIEQVAASAEDISYAFIQDHEGQVLSHTFSGGFPVQLGPVNAVPGDQRFQIRLISTGSEEIYDFASPVMAGAFRVGTVRLGLLRAKISDTVNELLWSIIAVTILAVVTADIVGFTLTRNLTGRIKALRDVSESLVRGDLSVRAAPAVAAMRSPGIPAPLPADTPAKAGPWAAASRVVWGDEIDHLAQTFDAMTLALRGTIDSLASSKEVLQRSEAKYRRIFEDSMDMIFIADRDGRLVDMNPAGRSLLAFTDRDALALGIGLGEVIRDTAEAEVLLAEIRAQGYVKDRECTMVSRAGRELEVLLSLTARRDDQGQIVEFEGIVKDITRRKLMRRQLLQADKLASLGQLSAGVAHEINNPLGLILGYTQLLIRGEPEASQKLDDLRTIEKQVRNCKKIVEDLLNFARRTETFLAEVRINEALEAVIGVIRHQLELANIRVLTVFDPGLPPILGDSQKLKQVFMNLLMNAQQAIDKHGTIQVTTSWDPHREVVQVVVADDGPGIPADVRGRIFDPFFTTKPTGQGTGLGLSVSYGIIEDHEGEITAGGEEGQGAVFTIRLPVQRRRPPKGHPDA
jgi:two-component system NtrC family sensor kinase